MMATSLVSISPMGSLSMLSGRGGGGRGVLSAGGIGRAPSPPLLRTSFLPSSSLSFPSSSLSGLSLGINFAFDKSVIEKRRGLVVRAGKKYALCQTKRNRSRKSLARTHGFRRRMRTMSGRAILRRRRAKGRKVLCTKTNPNSGKRA